MVFELFDSFEDWYKNKSFLFLKTSIEDKALDELIAIKDQRRGDIKANKQVGLNVSSSGKNLDLSQK